MDDLLEPALAADLAAGRDAAYATLYDRLGAPLFRTARALTGSATEAEDLVQDVFVALVRGRAGLASVRNLKAYCFTALRHAAAARAQRRAVERRTLAGVAVRTTAEAPEATDSSADPPEALTRALEALPPEQREIIALRIEGGLTFAEMASALDINPNTAASRYQYALEKLRRALPEA